MKKLPRHWMSGLFLGGCLLLLPQAVVSLDPLPVPCHNPERCFTELLVELDKPLFSTGASSKAGKLFQQVTTAYSHTPWAIRARLRYGYAVRALKPQEAIPLLRNS